MFGQKSFPLHLSPKIDFSKAKLPETKCVNLKVSHLGPLNNEPLKIYSIPIFIAAYLQ